MACRRGSWLPPFHAAWGSGACFLFPIPSFLAGSTCSAMLGWNPPSGFTPNAQFAARGWRGCNLFQGWCTGEHSEYRGGEVCACLQTCFLLPQNTPVRPVRSFHLTLWAPFCRQFSSLDDQSKAIEAVWWVFLGKLSSSHGFWNLYILLKHAEACYTAPVFLGVFMHVCSSRSDWSWIIWGSLVPKKSPLVLQCCDLWLFPHTDAPLLDTQQPFLPPFYLIALRNAPGLPGMVFDHWVRKQDDFKDSQVPSGALLHFPCRNG